MQIQNLALSKITEDQTNVMFIEYNMFNDYQVAIRQSGQYYL